MLAKVFGFLRTRGFQKGVVGSSRTWLGVWAGLSVARWLHERLGKEEVVVERVVLRPGEAVEIRDTSRLWKDEKKRGRKRK